MTPKAINHLLDSSLTKQIEEFAEKIKLSVIRRFENFKRNAIKFFEKELSE